LPARLPPLLDQVTPNRAHGVLATVSRGYPPRRGRLPTCYSPVRHGRPPKRLPYDLHALGTPPALFLSQDQTLHQDTIPITGFRFLDSRYRGALRRLAATASIGIAGALAVRTTLQLSRCMRA